VLETLFILGVNELMALALDKATPANAWAAKLLALIGKWIEHFDEKICEASEVYRQEKTKLGKFFRRDVWLPESPLYRAIKRELWHCLFYRGELISPRFQPYFPKKEYLPFLKLKLPKLSPKSWRKWWKKPLWELVQKHNLGLLDELRGNANRNEESWTYKDGLSKREVKPRRLYWNAFETQFDNHLKAFAQRWEVVFRRQAVL